MDRPSCRGCRCIKLDQVAHFLPALGRAKRAVQARHHAARRRRPNAKRVAHRHHLVAGAQVGGRTHRGGNHVVRDFGGLQHRQIVFRLRACHGCRRLQTVRKRHGNAVSALHHMQVGENHAFVHDHHACAHAAFARTTAFMKSHHPHHRRRNLVVGFGRRRGELGGFEGFEHSGIDVVLRQLLGAWPARLQQRQRQHQRQRTHTRPQQIDIVRRELFLQPRPAMGGGGRWRWRGQYRIVHLVRRQVAGRVAVHGGPWHGVTLGQ